MSDDADYPVLEDDPKATGFPHKVMPSGWFQIAWSHDLKPGDVRPLRYFKQHQVLFRTEEGEAVVMSAFCAHFGAHLGHGGRVEGCNIVCPYHGWVWSSEGRSVLVPHEGGPSPVRRRMRKWHTAETNGIVWLWHDALRRDPMWAPPPERRHEAEFLPVSEHTGFLYANTTVQPQYVMENVVDIDHLIFVHRNTLLPEMRSPADYPEIKEEQWLARFDYAAPGTLNTCYGVGATITEFPRDPERPWRSPALVFTATTPIDNEKSDIFGTILVCQDRGAEGGDGDVPVGSALKRVREQAKQTAYDFEIWDNMVYMNRPAYSRYEGKLFRAMRNWARRFYPEEAGDGAEAEPAEAAASS